MACKTCLWSVEPIRHNYWWRHPATDDYFDRLAIVPIDVLNRDRTQHGQTQRERCNNRKQNKINRTEFFVWIEVVVFEFPLTCPDVVPVASYCGKNKINKKKIEDSLILLGGLTLSRKNIERALIFVCIHFVCACGRHMKTHTRLAFAKSQYSWLSTHVKQLSVALHKCEEKK